MNVNLTTAGRKNYISCLEAKCVELILISDGGKNNISKHIKSLRHIHAAEAQKGNTYNKHNVSVMYNVTMYLHFFH